MDYLATLMIVLISIMVDAPSAFDHVAEAFQSISIIKVQSSQVTHYLIKIYEKMKLLKHCFVVVGCNTKLIICHTL